MAIIIDCFPLFCKCLFMATRKTGAKRKADKRPTPSKVSKKSPIKSKVMTRTQITRTLEKQEKAAKKIRQEKATTKRYKKLLAEAVKKFKPHKTDWGKIVMVSTTGKRNPQAKGKKGYLFYITKTGKKRVIREKGEKVLKPKQISQIKIPLYKNLRNPVKKFQHARREVIRHKKIIIKGKGGVLEEETFFNDATASIYKALSAQKSHRHFLITFMILVELPDGTRRTYTGQVSIGRRDHLSIEKAGIRNFVRMKFWAHIARELAFDGLVTKGSANHIRKKARNIGKSRDQWTDAMGGIWEGWDYKTVKVLVIEWKIEQLKK